MVLTSWYIRSNGEMVGSNAETVDYNAETVDYNELYGSSPNFFSLEIHHGGIFTKPPGRRYIDGKVSYVDYIDGDVFSVIEVNAMLEELGYVETIPMWYHFKVPESDLDYGLRALGSDDDVRFFLTFVAKHKLIEVYVELMQTKLKTYQKINVQSSVVIEEVVEQVEEREQVEKKTEKNRVKKRLFKQPEVGEGSVAKLHDVNIPKPVELEIGQGIVAKLHDLNIPKAVEPEIGEGTVEVGQGNVDCMEGVYIPKPVETEVGQGSGTMFTNVEVVQGFDLVNDAFFNDVFFNDDSIPRGDETEVRQGSGSVVRETEVAHETVIEDDIHSDSENGEDSDSDSTDSDFIMDDEHRIEDVDVDMTDFRNNIDTEIEWIGCNDNPDRENEVDEELENVNFDDLESDTDSENGDPRKQALKKIRREKRSNPEHKTSFFVGQTFGTKKEIKELVTLHSIESRRQLKIVKNDKTRFRVICEGIIPVFSGTQPEPTEEGPNVDGPNVDGPSEQSVGPGSQLTNPKDLLPKPIQSPKGVRWVKPKTKKSSTVDVVERSKCPWVLHVSKVQEEETWVVKTFSDIHKCLQARQLKTCTSKFLSTQIEEHLLADYTVVGAENLRDQIQKRFEIGFSKHKIYRAVQKAKGKIMGDVAYQYSILRDYILELQSTNPDTTVKLDFEPEPNPNTETRVFRRIYVCLGALKRGFKAGGRELLGLDGCFMKGQATGQCLTVVGVDNNNQTYPLAYAIVESENRESWTWFLECLGGDLELDHMSNFTFITDRQKGIIPAIAQLFPCVEHRFCLKHIYDNMKLTWRGQVYKDLLWRCATATTVIEFTKNMQDLKKVNNAAYEWLKEIPARHWARSHFTGRAKCDVLLNNMCEVLNRQLVDGRDKPIILALEYIREYLMKRLAKVQRVIDKSDGPLTPNATIMFNSIKKEAAKYKATWNGGDQYQVVGPWMDQCVVNMAQRTCSCRKWELTGMPCKHAVSTIWDMALNQMEVGIPESFVHQVYWLETWKAMYSFKIGPTKGRSFWPTSDCPIKICPPKFKQPIGRPKKKRRMSAVDLEIVKEGKLSRAAVTVKCGKCKGDGHNIRTCKVGSSETGGSSNKGKSKKAAIKKRSRAN